MNEIRLNRLNPYFMDTNIYTELTDDFIEHFDKAINCELLERQGAIPSYFVNNPPKTNKNFRLFINNKKYVLGIPKMELKNCTFEDWKNNALNLISKKKEIFLYAINSAFHQNINFKANSEIPFISKMIKTESVIISYNGTELKTQLLNRDAINLISKLNSPFTRQLYRMAENDFNNNELLYQIHYIANKTIEKFGLKIITFILSLPSQTLNDNNLREFRTYDKVPLFLNPIKINISNKEDYFITFYSSSKSETKGRIIRKVENEIKFIGFLTIEGYINTRLENFNPHLNLYIDNNKKITYCNLSSSKCIICNRKLTTQTSILNGIGPECIKHFGILYNSEVTYDDM